MALSESDIHYLSPKLAVSVQIAPSDMALLAAQGFRAVINNRPEAEGEHQPAGAALEAAAREAGLAYHPLPVVPGQISDADVRAFRDLLDEAESPALAFCRTGTRSTHLWALAEAERRPPQELIAAASRAGYDIAPLEARLRDRHGASAVPGSGARQFDVVVVGGGAAGCAVTASLLRRMESLRIAVVEPQDTHYYQPGFTLVGAGVFQPGQTRRETRQCIPAGAAWVRNAVTAFEPERKQVVLDDGTRLGYRVLVVCPGLTLDWDAIEGLSETLGRNGVTSNYEYGLAAYTWTLVQELREGRALFTQPPMPIKCAGAPQKAMYLSCDHWRRTGVLDRIKVDFCTAGEVLFGVAQFVPPLMEYVERYGANLEFRNRLVAVDGPGRKARFEVTDADGGTRTVEREFDMLHAVPPQRAPDFVRDSPLADAEGWLAVNPETLRHPRYGDVFSLGDVCGAPNAKTAAAVRKQAPVVAENVLLELAERRPEAAYDGYGSCPLIVERGRVILAEFGYGGKLLPTFPLDPTKPSWLAWHLKATFMPTIYFRLMLRGHEWFARPGRLGREAAAAEVAPACDYGAPGGAPSGAPSVAPSGTSSNASGSAPSGAPHGPVR